MTHELRFDGNVVIVTGGAGGLGRSQAFELARRGARVVVNDLGGLRSGGGADWTLAEAVVAEITAAGGEAVASADSVASAEGPRRIVEMALDTWGRVDGIVANAAIVRNRLFENLTDDDWDEVMAVNLRGVFRTLQAAYRPMKDNGGRIVVMTSTAGLCGAYGQANYVASKAGVQGLVRTIAWEGRQYGIRANAVAPSASDHRYAAPTLSKDNPACANRSPEPAIPVGVFNGLHRNTSARVTPIVLRLLHESCPVTGETYAANGGLYHRFAMVATDGVVLTGDPTTETIVACWDDIHGAGGLPGELDDDVIVWCAKAYADRFGNQAAKPSTH